MRLKKKGLVFIISAPSGSGKTTLCNLLVSKKLGLVRSISVTTRSPRKGEKDKRDYFFISRKDFQEKKQRGELLEWTSCFGHFYGTPRQFFKETLAQGKDILLSIDAKGLFQVKRHYPEAISIFILPPSLRLLEARLKKRSLDTPQDISKRLKVAGRELSHLKRYDYVVINDCIKKALARLTAIIIAERCKVKKFNVLYAHRRPVKDHWKRLQIGDFGLPKGLRAKRGSAKADRDDLH